MSTTKYPSEEYEHKSLLSELKRLYPDLLLEINPAAGMKLTPKQGAKVKSLGYQAGTLDIFIPEMHTYIELKRQSGGRLTKEQAERIPRLEAAGYNVIVGYGAVDALDKLTKTLKQTNGTRQGVSK